MSVKDLEMKERGTKVVIEGSIPELVSGFGKYQVFQCFLALLPIIFTAMSNTNFVFAAASTKYRCLVPLCETENTTSIPPDWWPSSVPDYKCTRPVFAENGTCIDDDIAVHETCDKWVLEDHNSVVTEFELPCREFKRTLISTIHNVGVLVGMPMIGFVSDRWGRRIAIIMNCLSVCIGALKTLVGTGQSGYIQYVVIEFFEAALVTGAYTSCFVLLVELIGTDKRIIGSALLGISINIGEILLSFIVWFVPYWRHFLLIIYCPAILFLTYLYLLEESMRWLLTNGKNEQAVLLLEQIAKWNRFVVPDKMKDLDHIATSNKEEGPKEKFKWKLVFGSPVIVKRLLVCAWWWFSASLVYYGLTFSSVLLPGNKYTNFALSSIISIPGELIAVFVLNKIGRKKTLIGGYVICGTCCIAIGFVPLEYKGLQITIFLIGKMFISTCFNVVYVYTSELMPTSARAMLMGTCSMVARVGSVLSPLTLLLGEHWAALPSVLFGSASIIAALLGLTTPETLHKELPDTIAQASTLT